MKKLAVQKAKPFVFGRLVSFLKEAQQELAKVSWPSREQAIRFTLIVITISLVVAVFIGGLDFIFTKLMELIIRL